MASQNPCHSDASEDTGGSTLLSADSAGVGGQGITSPQSSRSPAASEEATSWPWSSTATSPDVRAV